MIDHQSAHKDESNEINESPEFKRDSEVHAFKLVDGSDPIRTGKVETRDQALSVNIRPKMCEIDVQANSSSSYFGGLTPQHMDKAVDMASFSAKSKPRVTEKGNNVASFFSANSQPDFIDKSVGAASFM
jgi:hypothetical protein